MPLATNEMLAMATRFRVVIDGLDLGGWQKCDGIGFEVKLQRWKEGGTNTYLPYLNGRIEYTDVTLTRAITADGSARMRTFLASLHNDFKPTTASIEVLDAHGARVTVWSLRRVLPIKYKGPALDADSSKPATESLTLVHEGFL